MALHFRAYEALDNLAASFEAQPKASRARGSDVEVTFEVQDQAEPATRQQKAKSDATSRTQAKQVPKQAEPPPKEPPPKPPETEPTPQEPASQNRLAVRQKSTREETPENARFEADKANKVEEETVAKQRDTQSDEVEVRDEAPKGVSGERAATEETEEISAKQAQRAQPEPPSERAQPQPRSTQKQASGQQGGPSGEGGAGTPGTLGALESGQAGKVDIGRPATGGGGSPGQRAKQGDGGKLGQVDPRLRLSWSAYEQDAGSDALAAERAEAHQAARAARQKTGIAQGQGERWREFRAAAENYVPNVKPGNQTALNAAASPFASYLSAVHIPIHREFADKFLSSLPLTNHELASADLRTVLEIVLDAQGKIAQLGIIASSGHTVFDLGAYEAVKRAGPFPTPPEITQSYDGRVYFHWAFHRDNRACGTFNARAFKLDPRSAPDRPKGS